MKITRFEDLVVWQQSRDLAVAVYHSTAAGPFARDFGLRDQVRRASVSVMSNIAEGWGRYSRPELRRFLVIARGSVSEVQSQLHLALALQYISPEDHAHLNDRCTRIASMLAALRTSLDRS